MRWVMVMVAATACSGSSSDPVPQPAKPDRYVPLAGGETFGAITNEHCLVGTLEALRSHPNWMVRIDEKSSFEGNIDAPPTYESFIELDAKGARWKHAWGQNLAGALEPAEVAALERALAASCKEGAVPARKHLDDITWYEIGWGMGQTSAFQTKDGSEIERGLAPLFAAGRKHYLATHLAAARSTVLALKGKQHVGELHDKGSWKAWSATIDLGRPEVDDEDAVTIYDWAVLQPTELPPGPRAVSGTITSQGKARPIAIELVQDDKRRIRWQGRKAMAPLTAIGDANFYQYEY